VVTSIVAIFDRFGGINGSAYFIGGFGMTALTANNIVVVPIRSVRKGTGDGEADEVAV
jgi:hypothetical protein